METLVLCLSIARITDKLQGHLKTTSLILLSSAGAVYTLLTLVTTQVNNKGSPEDYLPKVLLSSAGAVYTLLTLVTTQVNKMGVT